MRKVAGLISAGLLSLSLAPAIAAEDYFKGKTINVVIGGGAGDGYDIYSRFLIRHLSF